MINFKKIPGPRKLLYGLRQKEHKPSFGALDILKYIGPGMLVTVGFIDPGNWAANIATGSGFGYELLWVVTLSTVMLIILQHNVAHLGIATGLCLAEASTIYIRRSVSQPILIFAVLASVATSFAEILGAAIALEMLFGIPFKTGSILVTIFAVIMLLTNSYSKIEKWIIGFVSIIGISFLYELFLVKVDWLSAGVSSIKPSIPEGSMLVIMSILGAVVMPHNLFLHSEVIQSRQWNLQDETVIKKQLKFEFADTILSMIVGWAINSAMIILAASTFFRYNIKVDALPQAVKVLQPLLGNNATTIFAVSLLFAGIASSITSGMAGGSIVSGMYGEPYDASDNHSRGGILISLLGALIVIFFIHDSFKSLILSQAFLSIQLPFTLGLQIYLTSSRKVMGKYVNSHFTTILLILFFFIITFLNLKLLAGFTASFFS
jgi:manganese transport protein